MSADSRLDRVRRLLADGAEQVGAAAGVLIGWGIAGPEGAMLGAVGGTGLKQAIELVGADIYDRLLGPRERYRIGTALGYAIATIEQNYKDGKSPSDASFFTSADQARPKAEELLEAVLLKARDTYEEKKLRYLGAFYGNVAFPHSTVIESVRASFELPTSEMNLFFERANGLSYRQMLILALIARKHEFQLSDTEYGDTALSPTLEGIFEEVLDLGAREMIAMLLHSGYHGEWPVDVERFVPADLQLLRDGGYLYALLNLASVPHDEIQEQVADHLL